jgi:hypothetical protein
MKENDVRHPHFPRAAQPHFLGGLIPALVLSWLLPAALAVAAQNEPPMDDDTQRLVIDAVLEAFETHYVYPELAQRMSAHVRDRVARGAYSDIASLEALCEQLSGDLRDVTDDRHIWVEILSPDDLSPAIGEKAPAELIARRARANFGWRKVECLPGNIGYLKLDRFDDAAYAGETAVAGLNYLANCEAVIVDLRENHGGYGSMGHLIASYFFAEPRLLGSLYFTETDSLEQAWTQAHVPGKRLDQADLYILTSRHTASGAEAFSYNLKHLGRAVIVGEKTRGAAHWTEDYDFPEIGVRASIPIARPINPVTGTSWERTGVMPDIAVPAADAPLTAGREALNGIIARCSDEGRLRELRWQMTALEARLNRPTLSGAQMREICGLYEDGRYEFRVEDAKLIWTSSDGTDYGLVPLARDIFGFDDGDDDYRLRILRDGTGGVSGFRLLSMQGEHSIHPRTGDVEAANDR